MKIHGRNRGRRKMMIGMVIGMVNMENMEELIKKPSLSWMTITTTNLSTTPIQRMQVNLTEEVDLELN